jgi:hypothetical protein
MPLISGTKKEPSTGTPLAASRPKKFGSDDATPRFVIPYVIQAEEGCKATVLPLSFSESGGIRVQDQGAKPAISRPLREFISMIFKMTGMLHAVWKQRLWCATKLAQQRHSDE